MRRSRILVALCALAAAVAVTANAGAATQPASRPDVAVHVQKLDLSSMTKIQNYLRSIGMNPRQVVIQRGQRNYAGPRCPGKRWTCTTRTRVLQVGSQNIYECTGGTGSGAVGGTQTCSGTGIQSGDKNTFRCIEKTTVNPAVQDCAVTQNGPSNYAFVDQLADLSGNTDQDATQTAKVEQNGSGKNEVHIHQRIKETTSTATKQDGHQVAIVHQDATGTAKNFSDVHEYIDERASGAAVTQMQDTEGLPAGVTDCAGVTPPDPLSPTQPNQCASVRQFAGPAGGNESHLHQLIDEDAKSSTATNQDQGQELGGSDADVHQEIITPDSPTPLITSTGGGGSDSHADQARRQNVSGPPGSDQTQTDYAGRCCGVSQKGGENNRQDINQDTSQKSDGNTAAQNLTLVGECNTENGSCVITQHGRNDEFHSTYNCGSPNDTACPSPAAITHCLSAEATEGGEGSCLTPDDSVDLTAGDGILIGNSLLPGTPLSGFELTMGLIDPTSVLPAP
jgi:hypothetical protein